MEDGEPLNFSPTLLFKKMSFYGLNFRGPNLFKDIHLKDFILKVIYIFLITKSFFIRIQMPKKIACKQLAYVLKDLFLEEVPTIL